MVGVALVQCGFRPAVGLLHAKGGVFLSMRTIKFLHKVVFAFSGPKSGGRLRVPK